MPDETTARLELPLLHPGQAQKEMFHNEALARIDAMIGACVVADGVDSPPAAPAPGECWIVGSSPVGAWAGHAGALAAWTMGGWHFVAPFEGMEAWHATQAMPMRYLGGSWRIGEVRAARLLIDGVAVVGPRGEAIAEPTGGEVQDQQSRLAIAEILATMRTHGLIIA